MYFFVKVSFFPPGVLVGLQPCDSTLQKLRKVIWNRIFGNDRNILVSAENISVRKALKYKLCPGVDNSLLINTLNLGLHILQEASNKVSCS